MAFMNGSPHVSLSQKMKTAVLNAALEDRKKKGKQLNQVVVRCISLFCATSVLGLLVLIVLSNL